MIHSPVLWLLNIKNWEFDENNAIRKVKILFLNICLLVTRVSIKKCYSILKNYCQSFRTFQAQLKHLKVYYGCINSIPATVPDQAEDIQLPSGLMSEPQRAVVLKN